VTKRAVSLTGSPTIAWLERPVSRAGMVLLVALIAVAPWVLFFDPIAGFRHAHIPRDPAAFGRLDMPELPEVYDAAGLLDLPERGRSTDQDVIRRAMAPYVFMESEPRPPWLTPDEPWPPSDLPRWSESDVDVSE